MSLNLVLPMDMKKSQSPAIQLLMSLETDQWEKEIEPGDNLQGKAHDPAHDRRSLAPTPALYLVDRHLQITKPDSFE